MQRYQWGSEYELRIPEMDADHHAIFDAAMALREMKPARTGAALKQLTEHVTRHFAAEERRMRSTGYGAYEWHKRQHGAALKKAAELAALLKAGRHEAALASVEGILDWIDGHIRIADRMLAAHLQRCERTHAAAPKRRATPQCVIA